MSAQRLVLPFDGDTRWRDLGCDLRIAAGSDVPVLITGDRDAARLDRLTAGLFRADLFYRLNLVHLTMPRVLGAGDTQLDALLASLSV